MQAIGNVNIIDGGIGQNVAIQVAATLEFLAVLPGLGGGIITAADLVIVA